MMQVAVPWASSFPPESTARASAVACRRPRWRTSASQRTTPVSRLIGRRGILERRRYSERPPRHEYFLTEKGLDLWPVMISLLHWGDRHLEWPDGPPVVVVHKGCGGRVTDRRICERCGKHLEVREARAENGPGAPAELRDAA